MKVIREALIKYGPLLLSNFRVSARFRNFDKEAAPSTVFRLGENEAGMKRNDAKGKGVSRHAMMVVGMLREDILLVQNWWRKAPFVQSEHRLP